MKSVIASRYGCAAVGAPYTQRLYPYRPAGPIPAIRPDGTLPGPFTVGRA